MNEIRLRLVVFSSISLAILLMPGCAPEKKEDEVQKVIDYGTGKTPVEAYQQLQDQIKTINEERRQQFEE